MAVKLVTMREEMRDASKGRKLPARGLEEMCVAAGELGRTAVSSRRVEAVVALSRVEEDSGRLKESLRCFSRFLGGCWCV